MTKPRVHVPEGVPIVHLMQHFRLNAEQVRDLLMQELTSGRRLVAQAEGTRTDHRRSVWGDVGSMVLNHYVLPAVLR